jgi:hypothetical protein
MSRAKKTVALEAVSESGTSQPEIQVDKIHRFPVIVSSPSDQGQHVEYIAAEMNTTNSYGITGAKLGVNEDNTTHDRKSKFRTRCGCVLLRLRSNMRLIDRVAFIYAVSRGLNNVPFTFSRRIQWTIANGRLR